jgi:hypothetical protein
MDVSCFLLITAIPAVAVKLSVIELLFIVDALPDSDIRCPFQSTILIPLVEE